MAPMPNINQRLAKPVLPFTPTQDENGHPTTCIACGQIAFGIGRAVIERGRMVDPGFMCKPCIVAAGDLTKLERLSVYELKALDAGVESVGEWLEQKGVYDLTLMDELDRRMIVKAAVEGFGRGVRTALREAPF